MKFAQPQNEIKISQPSKNDMEKPNFHIIIQKQQNNKQNNKQMEIEEIEEIEEIDDNLDNEIESELKELET